MKDCQPAQKINAPRGTADTLPAESWKWRAVEAIAREVASLYHFAEIRTPVYEFSELFHRGVGETTDIVSKETFTFADRGGDSITLRPEGTAGVVRAVIENNLVAQEGSRQKLFYIGPNFRYQRPQKGRLRQHHQFGVEAFGIAEPEQDVECILLQLDFYRRCGIRDSALEINSLGDKDSKQRYRDALVKFLTPKLAQLSEESQRRLVENPLRILDSKDPRDATACGGAPPAAESLSEASREHFERVQEMLKEALGSVRDQPEPRSRIRLLHGNSLGSHDLRPGIAERHRRRRTIRQSRGKPRRPADAGRRIWDRVGKIADCVGGAAGDAARSAPAAGLAGGARTRGKAGGMESPGRSSRRRHRRRHGFGQPLDEGPV